MSKPNPIKILVKVNRDPEPKDYLTMDRKDNLNSDVLINKVSIDRKFTDEAQNNQIFATIEQINSKEENNTIFAFINWSKNSNIFFREEVRNQQKYAQKEKGLMNIIADSIIQDEYVAKVSIKVLEIPTFNNIIAPLKPVDEEGFFEATSFSSVKDLFNLIPSNNLDKAMMIILKGASTRYHLLYYPIDCQSLVSELCNNFCSQKFLLANYFKHIQPPKFCFFWNVHQCALPDAVQLIMILQSGKGDKTVIQGAKKEMQRLQVTYKRLNQKYRKIMNTLSKCIDLENAQIDKKALLYVDCIPSSQKPSDKLKISAIRKSQNDEQIERLQKDVAQLQSQIAAIRDKHREKMTQHENMLTQKQDQKAKLWKLYQTYMNPKVKIDHTNNHNLYWKPSQAKVERQSEQVQDNFNQSIFTKNNLNSHKNLTKKNLENKVMSNQIKKQLQFDVQEQEQIAKFNKQEQIKQQQIKFQIKSIFTLIERQQRIIEKALHENSHQLKTFTINQIKNRQNQLAVNNKIINQCLKNNYSQERYMNWIKQEKCFQKFQKQLRQKQMATQTLTTIREI